MVSQYIVAALYPEPCLGTVSNVISNVKFFGMVVSVIRSIMSKYFDGNSRPYFSTLFKRRVGRSFPAAHREPWPPPDPNIAIWCSQAPVSMLASFPSGLVKHKSLHRYLSYMMENILSDGGFHGCYVAITTTWAINEFES